MPARKPREHAPGELVSRTFSLHFRSLGIRTSAARRRPPPLFSFARFLPALARGSPVRALLWYRLPVPAGLASGSGLALHGIPKPACLGCGGPLKRQPSSSCSQNWSWIYRWPARESAAIAGQDGLQHKLTDHEWSEFWDALNEEPLRTKLRELIAARKETALRYFEAQGLLDETEWAVVDLGWHLTCQQRSQSFLAAPPRSESVRGYYLGLHAERRDPSHCGIAQGLFYGDVPDRRSPSQSAPSLFLYHGPRAPVRHRSAWQRTPLREQQWSCSSNLRANVGCRPCARRGSGNLAPSVWKVSRPCSGG